MSLEKTFDARFNADAAIAQSTGTRTGLMVAIGVGLVAGMPLFAQCESDPAKPPLMFVALLNWAGSQFILKGYLNYAQMLQVYNLVLFSLTFGTAMLDFSESPMKV